MRNEGQRRVAKEKGEDGASSRSIDFISEIVAEAEKPTKYPLTERAIAGKGEGGRRGMSTNIVEVLRWHTRPEFFHTPFRGDDTGVIVTIGVLRMAIEELEGLRAENERLQENTVGLSRAILELQGEIERLTAERANRYWEGRWRDEKADNARLRAGIKKIAELRYVEDTNEPFDEALDIADALLAGKDG